MTPIQVEIEALTEKHTPSHLDVTPTPIGNLRTLPTQCDSSGTEDEERNRSTKIVGCIAEQVDKHRETVKKILTKDRNIRKVWEKMVPTALTEEQIKEESQFAKTF
jgi:hypothetical protein